MKEHYKILILASDGIWDRMTNEDVANFVFPYYGCNNVTTAVNELIKEAYNRWGASGLNADDISCVIVFLYHPTKHV